MVLSDQIVPPERAFELMGEGKTLVDVRTPEEFAAGHPKAAVNIPWLISTAAGRSPNPNFLNSIKTQFPDPAATLLVMCKSGARSAAAKSALVDAGFSGVVDVDGGFMRWEQFPHLPCEK